MGKDAPCENGGVSIALMLLISSLVVVILSTIDFHTGLVWAASPLVDAEVRYIVTVFSIATMFVYTYCQYLQLRVKIDSVIALSHSA